MNDITKTAAELVRLGSRIGCLYTRRFLDAQENFYTKLREAASKSTKPIATESLPQAWPAYITDAMQRWILFWDTLRQRGDAFIKHERAGKPPVLVFAYETIVDGRTLNRPVNYALVRITPPSGVVIDETKRPFVIVDPRAGHGPGIGGFKQDSQVGVALKAGHPVYFVIFYARPEPGQTLEDVCHAEAQFLQAVIDRHPQSPTPAVIGNCQGGWASMMLAAAHPDLIGCVVINGAPMSYWSGSWSGEASENPMRYSGGLLGGSWSALLCSDLGNGLFDGAALVVNFERLNPANTFWDKYYHLYANIDTEPRRFLEFERWWGGYSLMNEAEIRWIVNNLFIGNRLARGEAKGAPHSFIDLKEVRSPIVIFSSAGDNITPPQQALNWIADVYSSTEEIKANGQVIVGLFHEEVGHLGIFVSGRVAKKEHAQIVEVLKYIEALRPGLYQMEIHQVKGSDGRIEYQVTIEERRLEDLRKINRLERRDERAFEVVAEVSALNEHAYTLFARPFIRPLVNEGSAELGRLFHPLRWQRWALSNFNPGLWPVSVLASSIKANRQAAPPENMYRRAETTVSNLVSAGLDLYRDLRDASMEALFFQLYGPAVALGVVPEAAPEARPVAQDPRELPLVREALAAIGKGGYPEAIALIGALVGAKAGRVPLARLELVDRFIRSDMVLSEIPPDTVRRIKSEQAVVAELEPERALQSLPRLLANPADRLRALALLEETVSTVEFNPDQKTMVDRIRHVLHENGPRSRRKRSRHAHKPVHTE